MSAKNTTVAVTPTSIVPELPFQKIMADAMTSMVKDILNRINAVQKPGYTPTPEECLEIKAKDLPVCIRFRTDREDVKLPLILRKLVNEKKGKLFDIILDCYFKNLVVGETSFSVCLHITRTWMTLEIPYSALTQISAGPGKTLNLEPYFPDDVATHKDDAEAVEPKE